MIERLEYLPQERLETLGIFRVKKLRGVGYAR